MKINNKKISYKDFIEGILRSLLSSSQLSRQYNLKKLNNIDKNNKHLVTFRHPITKEIISYEDNNCN